MWHDRQRSGTMRATDRTQCRVNSEIREVLQLGTVSDAIRGTGLCGALPAEMTNSP